MAGENEALRATEVGAGEHIVAEPSEFEGIVRGEDGVYMVGNGLLVAADRRDVDELGHPSRGDRRPARGRCSVTPTRRGFEGSR